MDARRSPARRQRSLRGRPPVPSRRAGRRSDEGATSRPPRRRPTRAPTPRQGRLLISVDRPQPRHRHRHRRQHSRQRRADRGWRPHRPGVARRQSSAHGRRRAGRPSMSGGHIPLGRPRRLRDDRGHRRQTGPRRLRRRGAQPRSAMTVQARPRGLLHAHGARSCPTRSSTTKMTSRRRRAARLLPRAGGPMTCALRPLDLVRTRGRTANARLRRRVGSTQRPSPSTTRLRRHCASRWSGAR